LRRVFETRRLKEYHGRWRKEENVNTIIPWKILYYINIDKFSMRNFYCEKREAQYSSTPQIKRCHAPSNP